VFAGFWHSCVDFIKTWGSNSLVDLFLGALLTLLAVFFRRIVNGLAHIFAWFWAIVRKRGKDYRFERAYLHWMINRYRYLGLLPARTVTSLWGEQRNVVNLEEVYVTLQVSESGSERRDTGAYRDDASSWRRPPWWHWPLPCGPCLVVCALRFCYRTFSFPDSSPSGPLYPGKYVDRCAPRLLALLVQAALPEDFFFP